MRIVEILKSAVERGASDIHLVADDFVAFRISGKVEFQKSWGKLTSGQVAELVYSVMTEKQRKRLEEELSVDFSVGIKDVGRFRVNAFYERGRVSAVFRVLPEKIRTMEELGLPPIVKELCKRDMGLILVTGPTGSGKTTTLASMVEFINQNFEKHIITIEDPIEYVYERKKCIIRQRELFTDTPSFSRALRDALREDPDVILVGEMRDRETIKIALTAAETGHLVFGTLHTNTAVETINRIVGVFDEGEQPQIMTELSFVLQGVISQRLLPRIDKPGRVLAYEILVPNTSIRNLIRTNKIHQIYAMMQSGQRESGMITMNQRLAELVRMGIIKKEIAMQASPNKEELKKLLGGLF